MLAQRRGLVGFSPSRASSSWSMTGLPLPPAIGCVILHWQRHNFGVGDAARIQPEAVNFPYHGIAGDAIAHLGGNLAGAQALLPQGGQSFDVLRIPMHGGGLLSCWRLAADETDTIQI